MRLPRLMPIKVKAESRVVAFTSLNRNDRISDNEIADSKDISLKMQGVIMPRPPREVTNAIITPYGVYAANGKLCYVSGTNFYYDGIVKGAVTAGRKSFADFNGKIIIYPDKVYYDYISNTFGNIATSPDIDYVCDHMNRLFGVKGDNIYATKLGEYNAWTTFAGVNTDSWAVDTGTPGNFTAIRAYQNHVVMWKPEMMFELYGAYPAQFQTQEVAEIGCCDARSISEVGNVLYFAHRTGIYRYAGGMPDCISRNLNLKDNITEAIAETDGRMYYVAIKTATEKKLYVFDTLTGFWIIEDDLDVISMTSLNGKIYALTANGNIYKFGSGAEVVEWYFETNNFDENMNNNKALSEVVIPVELANDASLQVYVKVNHQSDYQLIGIDSKPGLHNFRVKPNLLPGERYSLKIAGKGMAKIFAVTKKFVVGGEY